MGPAAVVVEPPSLDDLAGIGEIEEPVLVEAFVAEPPVEAFDEGVLGRLAEVDEVEADAVAPGPLVEHLADHLRPVVQDDLLGQPAGLGQALQDPHDTGTRQRGVDLDRRAFAREVVDDVQRPHALTGGQEIVLEVHGPALVRRLWHQHGLALDPGQPLPLALAHLQALLGIHPVHRLVIDPPTLAAEQGMQAPIAQTPALARQLLEPLAQRRPLLPSGSVLPGRKVEAGQPAGAALGQTVRLDQVR